MHWLLLLPFFALMAGNLPQQQWTDIFKESGPGGLGSGESESAVDITLFSKVVTQLTTVGDQAARETVAPHNSTSCNSSPRQQHKLILSSTVSCGPHRLLAGQHLLQGVSDNHSNSKSNNSGLLLGLTDDVDCAVVAATLQQQQQQGVNDHAGGYSSTAAAAAGSVGGIAISLNHRASIPALAYVAEGKTQRKHLLLGASSLQPSHSSSTASSMLRCY